MRRPKGIATFATLMLLTACAHVPLTSMYKLRNFNPITTDIDRLRIAVRIPDHIGIPENGVRLVLGSEHDERRNLSEEFTLKSSDDRTELENVARPGTRLFAYRIAAEDVERFNQLRQMIQIEKSLGALGSLEVKADVCRTTPELPPGIPISTFVNASETNGYVALLTNVDVLNDVERKKALALAPECNQQ